MIEITVNDSAIIAALQALAQRCNHLSPAMRDIGGVLTESTKQRFDTTTGPDGREWAPNTGFVSVKKQKEGAGSQPLTLQGILGDTIDYQLLGDDGVMVGSNMDYAAMQQFGGTVQQFPHLWGDIPARPFLGVSPADETKILHIIQRYLESAL